MTSFAYIFGYLPFWFASGSGAIARRVLRGMIAASLIAIFLIPATFYVIERLFAGRQSAEKPEEKPPATPNRRPLFRKPNGI